MRTNNTPPCVRRGFTMVEAIASIVVLSIIGTVASNMTLTMADSYFASSTRADLHAEASVTMDRIVREIRAIRLDASAAGTAADIDQTTASSIRWNETSGASHLTLAGGNLLLSEDGGTAFVLQGDVTEFGVQVFDESNLSIGPALSGSACDPIRRVQMTLGLTRDGITETLRAKVFIRSTMEGASQ